MGIKTLWRTILMGSKQKTPARIAVVVIAAIFLIYGIFRGEAVIVLSKAVNVCLECIGLG